MAPNQNFDNFTFLVGPDLVQKKSFIKNRISYLASAFGTSRPIHVSMVVTAWSHVQHNLIKINTNLSVIVIDTFLILQFNTTESMSLVFHTVDELI